MAPLSGFQMSPILRFFNLKVFVHNLLFFHFSDTTCFQKIKFFNSREAIAEAIIGLLLVFLFISSS